MDFSNRTVVVTGASTGVGRATAIGFCRDGARVVGIARTRSELEATAALCPPGSMHAVVGDIAKAQDVERLFAEAAERFGPVDILINNAALYPRLGFLEGSHDDWARVIETNVIGMALCCRVALPGMLERGFGRIVNLGSFAWRGPIPKASAYSVSKAAVGPLCKAIACEIDRSRWPDVLVNQLVPGIVRTRMSESGEEPEAIYPHVRFVAGLPRGGPTGETFLQSALYVEHLGRRERLKRMLRRALGRDTRG